MYSWSGDTSDWYGSDSYAFDPKAKDARERDAARAAATGPRTYDEKRGPIESMVDPRRSIECKSKNPIIVAVDVTGSMARWPAEIFDRLPLLYMTLSQYRPDLEICFAAIGDARYDKWPLQVTDFAKGYDLEQHLKALFGEGGGGDGPEGYGLFAWHLKHHVKVDAAEDAPFLIVYGDAPMHEKVTRDEIRKVWGVQADDQDAIELWKEVAKKYNTWFLRRPTGSRNDEVDQQWFRALGPERVARVHDEERAIDYALGIVARSWGHFEDFKQNMAARQAQEKVDDLARRIVEEVKPHVLKCPSCMAPLPPTAFGRWVCSYCKSTLDL